MGCKVELVKGGGLVLKIIIKKKQQQKNQIMCCTFLVCLLVGKCPTTSGEQSRVHAQAQIKLWYVVEQLLDLNLIDLRQNSL